MTIGGWFTFILATGSFTALFAWCLYKVFTAKRPDKMHGFEIDTKDSED